MWVVAKIKNKEIFSFKEGLKKKLGKDVKFYDPKIELEKKFKNRIVKYQKSLLEDYTFCYHISFKKKQNIDQLKFVRGLKFFLNSCELNQAEILSFINHCKNFENNNGNIRPIFFKLLLSKRAKFISGPFTSIIFEILEKQKNKLKILIGNFITTIPDNKNYLYRPVL